jgi:hypothetical protein
MEALSHEEKLGLEELYCRPHSRSTGDREINDQLVWRGMMEIGMAGGTRPLTHEGFAAIHEIQAEGLWPPSVHRA